MATNSTNIPQAAAETPQPPAPTLTPEGVVQQLRAIRAQIGELTPLTPVQRKALTDRSGRTPNPLLQASINVIDAADIIATAVRQPAAEVRQLHDEANRWTRSRTSSAACSAASRARTCCAGSASRASPHRRSASAHSCPRIRRTPSYCRTCRRFAG